MECRKTFIRAGVDWNGRQCRAINSRTGAAEKGGGEKRGSGGGDEGLGKIALDKKTSVGDLSSGARERRSSDSFHEWLRAAARRGAAGCSLTNDLLRYRECATKDQRKIMGSPGCLRTIHVQRRTRRKWGRARRELRRSAKASVDFAFSVTPNQWRFVYTVLVIRRIANLVIAGRRLVAIARFDFQSPCIARLRFEFFLYVFFGTIMCASYYI